MNVKDIHTINWQMSLKGPDMVVEGTEDIEQCIDVILKTRPGEDALRPHFGCKLFDQIDGPVDTAIPNMKKDILEALKQWETRIQVKSITAILKELSNVLFNIGYQTPEGNLETYEFAINGNQSGTPATPLSLSAVYQEGAYRYYISLSLDGDVVVPNAPASGFDSITNMMAWLNGHWYIYGAWFWIFGQKKIVLYVPANIANSGSLNIISDTNVLSAAFPILSAGEFYAIVFKDNNGNRITPFNDLINDTQGEVLAYVQANYVAYGTWTIEGNNLILNGDIPLDGFTLDIETVTGTSSFSTGFNTGFEA